ncbi:hypothetical protein DIPPA_04145 [Diplonema papillatum]|nr:hypothetical protein DIPPA_04145 [Diplonema papillatum]
MPRPLVVDVVFGNRMASIEELRRMLLFQLCLFSVLNIIVASVNLGTRDITGAERTPIITGMLLLATCVPFGFRGAWTRNAGMLSFFVLYGVLAGAARTVTRITGSVVVSVSCHIDQASFRGCIVQELPCLVNSTCASTVLREWNAGRDTAVNPHSCEAWGYDECRNIPDIEGIHLGITDLSLAFLIVDIFTSCLPVYVAYLYIVRLESHRAATHQTADLSSELDLESGAGSVHDASNQNLKSEPHPLASFSSPADAAMRDTSPLSKRNYSPPTGSLTPARNNSPFTLWNESRLLPEAAADEKDKRYTYAMSKAEGAPPAVELPTPRGHTPYSIM